MQSGAMVLGIIGGGIAFLMGLAGFTLGQVVSSASGGQGGGVLKLLSLGIPILGLVGAVMVKSKALPGGALMLVSGAAIFLLLGVHFFSLLPGVPLLLGGALGIADGAKGGS